MKKILSIVMALVMLVSFGMTVNAVTVPESEIMPLWDNITTVSNSISFNGTKGTASCEIYGDAGTTVTAQIKVYRQTTSGAWSYVGGTSGSSETRLLNLTVNFTGKSGYYYKSVLTTTVYKDGVGEDVTRTSYKTCP